MCHVYLSHTVLACATSRMLLDFLRSTLGDLPPFYQLYAVDLSIIGAVRRHQMPSG